MSYVIFLSKKTIVVICSWSLNLWLLCLKLYLSWLTILLSLIIYHLGKFWSSSILSPHRYSLLIRLPRNNCPNSKVHPFCPGNVYFGMPLFAMQAPYPPTPHTHSLTHIHAHARTYSYHYTHAHTYTRFLLFPSLYVFLYIQLFLPSLSIYFSLCVCFLSMVWINNELSRGFFIPFPVSLSSSRNSLFLFKFNNPAHLYMYTMFGV